MPRKGENITKRKDGRYEARFVKERDEYGKIKKYGFVYARSYLEVKKKREQKVKTYEKERKIKVNLKEETIANSISLWLECKISIKDSSYTNYYSIIHSKIIPFFESKTDEELDENLILDFIKSLQQEKLGNKRIRDILIVLKQYFKDKNINIKIDLPTVSTKKIETLKLDEISIIEKYAKKTNDVRIFAILLVLFTGVRIGELCALTWQDIDLENKIIHINKTLIRVKNKDPNSKNKTKIILDTPKTKHSIRDIPINEAILPYLKKFKKDNKYFFLTGSNSFITTKKYYFFYLRLLKKLSIKKYKFHILRHTFATRSLLCGMDIKTLSEILGHSSVKITLDLYVHVKEDEKLMQINKLTLLA